jgi:glycosyltransferase involved in cell wall biosynthesis
VNSDKPLISIIMNCYNGSNYLKEALNSVKDQTYLNWELVFWDNQSTDNSAEIFKNYQYMQFKYFYAPEHTPLGAARNKAINQASGEWIAFLDCDDIWLPDKLERQAKIVMQESANNSNLGLVYGRTVYLNEVRGEKKGYFEKGKYVSKDLPEGEIFTKLIKENFISMVSGLIRKDIIVTAGGIPEKYKQSEDYWLFLKAAYKHRCRAVQSFCCIYRLHDNNLSNTQIENGFLESIDILDEYNGKAGVKRAIQYNTNGYALYCIKIKKFKKAYDLLKNSGNILLTLQFIYNYFKRNIFKKTVHPDFHKELNL